MTQALGAIGDGGNHVDWWFIYKVPKGARGAGKTGTPATGYEYAYFDSGSQALAGSKHLLNDTSNALRLTLGQFPTDAHPSYGAVFYNDEYPQQLHKSNSGERGHCKGVLAFDTATDSAVWLLHSTPRFPLPGGVDYPADELDYGQTFLCVTLKDVRTAEAIARQMTTQQGPQTYGPPLPPSAGAVWHDLVGGRFRLAEEPSTVAFTSRAGAPFRSIGKSRVWGQDLWGDAVGPDLKVDLDVESWRRGAIPPDQDGDKTHDVEDDTAIDLGPLGFPYAWPETKDHAKWATSLKDNADWVCVADINRQASQARRGGGAICFQHAPLWHSLATIDRVTPPQYKSGAAAKSKRA